jgi:predicted nuclease of predicted toxin-antitoxin system
MRFLANENFPLAAVEALRNAGHDTAWVLSVAPGSTGDDVLRRSVDEHRVLLTFDKDFGELVFVRGEEASCGVVLFRVVLSTPEQTASFVAQTLAARGDWEGHFSVVEPGRIRMRALPTSAGAH